MFSKSLTYKNILWETSIQKEQVKSQTLDSVCLWVVITTPLAVNSVTVTSEQLTRFSLHCLSRVSSRASRESCLWINVQLYIAHRPNGSYLSFLIKSCRIQYWTVSGYFSWYFFNTHAQRATWHPCDWTYDVQKHRSRLRDFSSHNNSFAHFRSRLSSVIINHEVYCCCAMPCGRMQCLYG